MSETVKRIFIFVAGAGLGAFATWQFLKNKYEQIANEEIASVKEAYNKKNDISSDESEEDDFQEKYYEKTDDGKWVETTLPSEEEVNEYKKIVSNYTSNENEEEKGVTNMTRGPYVIKPEEFGNMDYDLVSLEYYADKVLVDEDDHPIQDVEYMVGEDSLEHFGEYEDDAVYVRNDLIKTDFEILLVESRYYEDDDDVDDNE